VVCVSLKAKDLKVLQLRKNLASFLLYQLPLSFCLVMEAVKSMLYRRAKSCCVEKQMYNTPYVITQITKNLPASSLCPVSSHRFGRREESSFIFNPRSWKNKSPGGKEGVFHFVVCVSLKAKDLKVLQLRDYSLLYKQQTRFLDFGKWKAHSQLTIHIVCLVAKVFFDQSR
jgi:hypothetical protein